MSEKNTTEKSAKQSNEKIQVSFFRRCIILGMKLILVGIFYLSFYLIYLDAQIRTKMQGDIWQLPVEVYAKIETIYLSEQPSIQQIKTQLLTNGYRQVNEINIPGDFKLENNTITLLRHSFPFPYQPEPQRVIRLRFEKNKLIRIEDLVQQSAVEQIKLAPKLITMLQSNQENRLATPLHQYPRALIDILLLVEDRHFYLHHGVDLRSISRALVQNIQAGKTVQGGSTLTQQLVKNLFLSNERRLQRKINEALMAIIVDIRYHKNTILETYLNEIFLAQDGNRAVHGFALASRFFFDRSIQELSMDQLALLVGMVKGPSLYNPLRNPEQALKRRNLVLKVMLDNQMITQTTFETLQQRPLGVNKQGSIHQAQPAFMQLVQQEIKQNIDETHRNLLSGARIFTTLDPQRQYSSEIAVSQTANQLRNSQKINDLEAAMIVANHSSGAIYAMVGGVDTQFAGFNRALQAQRQIGSLVKPAIYLAALTHPERYQLNTLLANQPITIKIPGNPNWQPKNYDNRFSHPVMLQDALARSINIPSVNLGMAIGLEEIINLQQRMGWDQVKIPKVPAMLLGSYTISPFDVTKLYQTIANGGRTVDLYAIDYIVSREGQMLYQHTINPKSAVSEDASLLTLYAMQQTVKQGTARRLQQNFAHYDLAGKTGTTNDGRDTWFVGIDGETVNTVWLGRDSNGKTKLTGSTGALPIYQHYLTLFSPTRLKLNTTDNIEWIGINSAGQWDCSNTNKIPVWIWSKSNHPCSSNNTVIQENPNENNNRPSVWDILKIQGLE